MNFKLEQAVELLAKTPVVLKSLLRDLSDAWVIENDDPDKWGPFDVVGHLIHGEETDWMARAEIILAQGENPEFEPFDRFAQFEKSEEKSLAELLDTFETLRRRNLESLQAMNITPEKLRLKGIHPAFGEVTLEQLLATWTVHDLTHIRQITIFLAQKYTEAVGPWKEYLSILK